MVFPLEGKDSRRLLLCSISCSGWWLYGFPLEVFYNSTFMFYELLDVSYNTKEQKCNLPFPTPVCRKTSQIGKQME